MSKRKDGTFTGNPQMIVRWEAEDLRMLETFAKALATTPQALVRKLTKGWMKRQLRVLKK